MSLLPIESKHYPNSLLLPRVPLASLTSGVYTLPMLHGPEAKSDASESTQRRSPKGPLHAVERTDFARTPRLICQATAYEEPSKCPHSKEAKSS